MIWSAFAFLFLYLLSLGQIIGAVRLQIRGTRHAKRPTATPSRLFSRAPAGGLTLHNFADISYYANISLANQAFTVLMDTGSSDLWVTGNVRNSTESGKRAIINYAVNTVTGPIKLAELEFAGHTTRNQAFLQVEPTTINPEGTGILGLGPSAGSFIAQSLPGDGAPVLDRIFSQNRTAPNYFTILLGRDKDPTDFFNGSVTVGEILSDYNAILDEPKITITKVPANESDDQHLQILLDADGIVGPDGKPITVISAVGQTPNKKQATVVLDCGFTLPQVPRSVSDAIYSRFQGSEYRQIQGVGGAWTLPCVQEVNVTFRFGGRSYPMHPLDMTIDPESIGLPEVISSDGERACIGTFQPFTYDRGARPNYDMVLGMAFMRNVYTLFDYGDFIQGSTTLADPYIQLLSITSTSEAHQDFVTVRLGGEDTTATRGIRDIKSSTSRSTMYYIIAAVAVVAIVVAASILFILRAKRKRRLRQLQ
ncbi:aspartic peptidase domain-containing protein [Panaeolus papilionaceus]|nr:aspartic peptidase domain-containing protein [Panaeolus papilionaceus]